MILEMITRPGRLFLAKLSLFAAVVVICSSSVSASAFELIIGTDPRGSFSYHSGKFLCRIFSKQHEEITCSLAESSDPIDNLTNVQGGSFDLALVDSLLLVNSTTGQGAFQFLDITYDRIRIVSPLYHIPLTAIVRNDAKIAQIDELPGKRINTGPFGSPEKQLFELFMQSQGWTEEMFPVFAELSSSLAQHKIAFRQGDVQILVHNGVHPDSDVQQLLGDDKASLIGFAPDAARDLLKSNPALSTQDIEKLTYPSLAEGVTTIGTTMALVSSADVDDETIRLLITALAENQQSLRALHPALSEFEIDKRPQWFGSIQVHSAITK